MRIPVEIAGNHVFLAARAGDRTLDLVLETGAGMTLLDREVGTELGLRVVGAVPGTGAAAEISRMSIAMLPSLKVGRAALENITVVLASLSTLQARAGRRFDGLLGADVLGRFVVEIDYASSEIVLHDPGTFSYSGDGAVLRFSLERNLIVLDAAIVGSDGREIPGRFVLDTGAGGPIALVLSSAFATDLEGGVEVAGEGLGGAVAGRLGRLAAFRLGPFELARPVALLSRTAAGFFAGSDLAGVFGNELLRRFRVFLDYPRSRVVLERNAAFDEPFLSDGSGLTLIAEGAALERVRVASVVPGSAGDEAGILTGDRILAVDGDAVTNLPDVDRKFLEPDRRRTIDLERDGRRVEVRLESRPLV